MYKKFQVISMYLAVMASVLVLSVFFAGLWGDKPEKINVIDNIIFDSSMTLKEFGELNNLENIVLKNVFKLKSKSELDNIISDYRMTEEFILSEVNKSSALSHEEESKNWIKIPLKFLSWLIFLFIIFKLMRSKKIKSGNRKILLFLSTIIFGVILGADPAPMGTIKDAVVLFGKTGVIFPPRFMAFIVMIIGGIFIANKFLCSWGCQAGVVQDLIFRLNRNKSDSKGIFRQYKIPFSVSNSIRIICFILLVVYAFLFGKDILGPVDPFKIFKPMVLGISGIIFLAVLFTVSLFIYRPWCHFFCPFGLAGWVVEKISIFKIRVDREKCTDCGACSTACPTNTMKSILNNDKNIPDCFSCGTCIENCPVNAVEFAKKK